MNIAIVKPYECFYSVKHAVPGMLPNPKSKQCKDTPSGQNSAEENGNNYTGVAMRLALAHYSPSVSLSIKSKTAIIRAATNSSVSPAFLALSIQHGYQREPFPI